MKFSDTVMVLAVCVKVPPVLTVKDFAARSALIVTLWPLHICTSVAADGKIAPVAPPQLTSDHVAVLLLLPVALL